MRAFVAVKNGNFPNSNYYLAWKALTDLGYSVSCFESVDVDKIDININTPVFAGVKNLCKVFKRLDIEYPPFNCYPKVLNAYYNRTINVSTLGRERKKFNQDRISVFVKPIKTKQFEGKIWNSPLDLITLSNYEDDIPVFVSDPVDIVSEFRVYVNEKTVLGVKNYTGDWEITPTLTFINDVIHNYIPSPIAYGLDVGVCKGGTQLVIEVNDACSLGNYGLSTKAYGEMILSRWMELTNPSMYQSH